MFGLRLLDARRQLDADVLGMDGHDKGDPLYFAIVPVIIGNLFCAVGG